MLGVNMPFWGTTSFLRAPLPMQLHDHCTSVLLIFRILLIGVIAGACFVVDACGIRTLFVFSSIEEGPFSWVLLLENTTIITAFIFMRRLATPQSLKTIVPFQTPRTSFALSTCLQRRPKIFTWEKTQYSSVIYLLNITTRFPHKPNRCILHHKPIDPMILCNNCCQAMNWYEQAKKDERSTHTDEVVYIPKCKKRPFNFLCWCHARIYSSLSTFVRIPNLSINGSVAPPIKTIVITTMTIVALMNSLRWP